MGLVHSHLDDTFREKPFCHIIIIQAASVLALCVADNVRQNKYYFHMLNSEKEMIVLELLEIVTFPLIV